MPRTSPSQTTRVNQLCLCSRGPKAAHFVLLGASVTVVLLTKSVVVSVRSVSRFSFLFLFNSLVMWQLLLTLLKHIELYECMTSVSKTFSVYRHLFHSLSWYFCVVRLLNVLVIPIFERVGLLVYQYKPLLNSKSTAVHSFVA